MHANVQTLIALFTLFFFMFQTILSKLRKREKNGINSVIDRQIHTGITPQILPPFGPSLTPFRQANSDALNLNIIGFSRKNMCTTQKEKNQDISEK